MRFRPHRSFRQLPAQIDLPPPGAWLRLSLAHRQEDLTGAALVLRLADGRETLVALRTSIGQTGILVRAPAGPVNLFLAKADGSVPVPCRGRLWVIGDAEAVARLAWQRFRKPDAGALWHAARTAIYLISSGQWREAARRLARQSGAADLASSLEIARMAYRDYEKRIAPRIRPKGSPIRVLACSHSLELEGAPISQFELLRGLTAQADITARVHAPKAAPIEQWYRKAGIQVDISSPPVAVKNAAAYEDALQGFMEFVRACGADVVHANTVRTFYAVEAAHLLGIPSVWNLRESEPWQGCLDDLAPALQQRALACFGQADAVIFVSEATRQAWREFEVPGRVHVVPNALDMSRIVANSTRHRSAGANSEVGIVMIGTVCERKGQLDLIRALRRLSPETADRIRVTIAGRLEQGYGRALKKEIEALTTSLRARVSLVEPDENIDVRYSEADILVLASRYESYPRVTLEAMAHGLAVVATPVFGVREQLEDDRSALFFPPGDIEALAARLERLVRDNGLRQALGIEARRAFERLPPFDDMVTRYAAIFRSVVGSA